jgi:cytochrome d ubiquinol oxidase subunit II
MVELWYGIVAAMLTAYVVLDGFDLGAGSLHLWVARGDAERRQVLAAIGPYWDANEVWLIATGGALFVAFPGVLASGLSGFYLAIFLVLWCLLLRGIAIEFRGHVEDPMWRAWWDAIFGLASALLAVCFGAALGNLIRGLPLDAHGWFGLAFFTDFSARAPVGILDWYTVAAGGFALASLMLHGALYLTWKTAGPVQERARRAARRLWIAVAIAWPLLTWATFTVNSGIWDRFSARPLAWLTAALALGGLGAAFTGLRGGRELRAFLGSASFLAGMLLTTAVSIFPVMLRALPDAGLSITAFNGSNDPAGLRTALGWWVIGSPLAIGYFVLLFRLHRGKALAAGEREGY